MQPFFFVTFFKVPAFILCIFSKLKWDRGGSKLCKNKKIHAEQSDADHLIRNPLGCDVMRTTCNQIELDLGPERRAQLYTPLPSYEHRLPIRRLVPRAEFRENNS